MRKLAVMCVLAALVMIFSGCPKKSTISVPGFQAKTTDTAVARELVSGSDPLITFDFTHGVNPAVAQAIREGSFELIRVYWDPDTGRWEVLLLNDVDSQGYEGYWESYVPFEIEVRLREVGSDQFVSFRLANRQFKKLKLLPMTKYEYSIFRVSDKKLVDHGYRQPNAIDNDGWSDLAQDWGGFVYWTVYKKTG